MDDQAFKLIKRGFQTVIDELNGGMSARLAKPAAGVLYNMPARQVRPRTAEAGPIGRARNEGGGQ